MKKTATLLSVIFLLIVSGCSKSGRRHIKNDNPNSEKTVIGMSNIDGIYKIPVEINDTKMDFIFDTGASMISMSTTEALFLYKRGTLRDSDFKGNMDFTDATGNISEGTIINLNTVKIGNRVLHDVEASVTNNFRAPLLLGQSALAQFGKVSIDYSRNEITFE